MDPNNSRRLNPFWQVLIPVLGLLMIAVSAPAEDSLLKNFNFDDCDPFQARAPIMAVNGKKAQLIAAEQTIYVVDLSFGEQRLTTELLDADGDPTDLGSLRQGQWILVKGFKHINGGVVASLVQRIDPPERPKPVVRKINKESRGFKRTQRRAAARDD